MTHPLTFRPLTEADLPLIDAIEQRASAHPWGINHVADSVHADHLCMAALLNDQLIGYGVSMVVADEANVLIITIDREQQGRGFGGQLLEQMMRGSVELGATYMFLEVRKSNTAAQQLYLNHGFNEVGVRKNYYQNEDGIVMAAELFFDDF